MMIWFNDENHLSLLTNNDKNGGTWNTDQSESDSNVDDHIMFWKDCPLHFLYKLKSSVHLSAQKATLWHKKMFVSPD